MNNSNLFLLFKWLLVLLLAAFLSLASAQTGATVALLDAGAEPRQLLRYQPQVGRVETIVSSQRTETRTPMAMEDMPIPQILTTRNTAEVRIEDVDAEGNIHFSYRDLASEIVDAEGVHELMLDTLRESMAAVEGNTARIIMTSRGIVLAMVDYQLPDDTFELSPPFPEEPVGIGARWQVESTKTMLGMSLTQVVLYELTALQGDLLTLSISITEDIDAQNLDLPMDDVPAQDFPLPAVESSSTSVIDLSYITPLRFEMRFTIEDEMPAIDGEEWMTYTTVFEVLQERVD